MSHLIISLHDVAPASFAESRRWLSIVERHGMVATLLVIPGPWRGAAMSNASDFVMWLHAAEQRGHEIALHGWEHQAVTDPSAPSSPFERVSARLRARGCAEFASLGSMEARQRVEMGLTVLRQSGFQPSGFVPPGWLARTSTHEVLRDLGFLYTTTQWAFIDLVLGTRVSIPSTSQRPDSVITGAAARANVAIVDQWVKTGRSFRVALHPDDLRDTRLVMATSTMLASAIRAGYHSLTYQAYSDTIVQPLSVGAFT